MALRRPVLSVEQAKRQAAGLRPSTDVRVEDAVALEPLRDIAVDLPEVRLERREPSGSAARGQPQEPVYRAVASPSRVQVFVSAVLPQPRTSRVFDHLCREYSPAKSLQMILRRAMEDYERLLEAGGHKNGPTEYPSVGGSSPHAVVQTSRMIREDLLAVARSHFDPLGLESARTFGRKLATAALAMFFENEKRS